MCECEQKSKTPLLYVLLLLGTIFIGFAAYVSLSDPSEYTLETRCAAFCNSKQSGWTVEGRQCFCTTHLKGAPDDSLRH
jgi:hypothetical protein